MVTLADGSAPAPSAGAERLELIDALRGFALAGVLIANLGDFSLYEYLSTAQREALPTAGFDRIAGTALALFVDGKAITLFSLLFGLGFAMQLERAQTRGADGLRRYLRRIGILLMIGLAHAYLVWWGDILLIYAMLALLLIPLRRLSDAALLATGLALALLWPLLAPAMDALGAGQASESDMNAANLAAFASPSYLTAMRQNIAYCHWAWIGLWSVFPFVFARFLLGYWAGRKHLLHDPLANRLLLQRLFATGAILGLVVTIATMLLEPLELPALDKGAGQVLFRIVKRIGPLGLGIAYATGFALLYVRPSFRQRLRVLAPVGRMALTNYLTQTVVGMTIFYGFGFGVGPFHGLAPVFAVWLLLFGAQIAFSHWWLARYHFGPMEWLWRSLTYGSAKPMRLHAVNAQAAPD